MPTLRYSKVFRKTKKFFSIFHKNRKRIVKRWKIRTTRSQCWKIGTFNIFIVSKFFQKAYLLEYYSTNVKLLQLQVRTSILNSLSRSGMPTDGISSVKNFAHKTRCEKRFQKKKTFIYPPTPFFYSEAREGA